jgi:hypothetical protein
MDFTWSQLIDAFRTEGWQIADDPGGITLETEVAGERTVLRTFARTGQGLRQARQFWQEYCAGQGELAQPSLDQIRASVQQFFREEQAAGPINSLEALRASEQRRQHMEQALQRLQHACRLLSSLREDFPRLPNREQVHWAQAIAALPNLAFMEIDTTGLSADDELTRFTLIDREGTLITDVLIRPTTCPLSPEASAASGISVQQLEQGVPLADAWKSIQEALCGRYILSFNQEWDVAQLLRAATRSHLEPVLVLGDCLQRRATRYYNGEYSLKLEELCARAGAPLPAKPHQTSIDRARGQRAVLLAMTQAVTDLRPPPVQQESAALAASEAEAESSDWDPFLDSDELP